MLLRAAVLLLALPGILAAQTLRGTIVDTSTELPISGATVQLVTLDGRSVAGFVTADGGEFSLRAPSAGEFMARVERLGYDTAFVGPLRLRSQGFLEVTIAVAPLAIPVDPVAVTVEPRQRALELAGFYERRGRIPGHFVDREEIERIGAKVAGDVLVTVQGARVLRYDGMADVVLRGSQASAFSAPGGCLPNIFLDGVLVSYQGPARDRQVTMNSAYQPPRINLDDVLADDIEAMEVYNGQATAPAQYAKDGGTCGLVLIWRTK